MPHRENRFTDAGKRKNQLFIIGLFCFEHSNLLLATDFMKDTGKIYSLI